MKMLFKRFVETRNINQKSKQQKDLVTNVRKTKKDRIRRGHIATEAKKNSQSIRSDVKKSEKINEIGGNPK